MQKSNADAWVSHDPQDPHAPLATIICLSFQRKFRDDTVTPRDLSTLLTMPVVVILRYLFSYLVTRASANPIHTTPNHPLATATERSNLTAGISISCDRAKYGVNPDLVDCRRALTRIPAVHHKMIWVDRVHEPPEPGPGQNIMPLPFRIMGSEARCYIEVILIGEPIAGIASMGEIDRAAKSLVSQCASEQSAGGIATNIGKPSHALRRNPGYRSLCRHAPS